MFPSPQNTMKLGGVYIKVRVPPKAVGLTKTVIETSEKEILRNDTVINLWKFFSLNFLKKMHPAAPVVLIE